jgi:hypothetical protein
MPDAHETGRMPVLHFEIDGTAGGYRAHMVRVWSPLHCLSATAVLFVDYGLERAVG